MWCHFLIVCSFVTTVRAPLFVCLSVFVYLLCHIVYAHLQTVLELQSLPQTLYRVNGQLHGPVHLMVKAIIKMKT